MTNSTAQGYGSRWRRVALAVVARDGGICHWCGGSGNEADHVVPRAEGGTDDPSNLVCACRRCNARRAGEWNRTHRRGWWRGGPEFFEARRTSETSRPHSSTSKPSGALAPFVGRNRGR